MKIQQTIALLACFTFCLLQASAQAPVQPNIPNYNKPKRFSDVPEKQALNLTEATALLDVTIGQKATVVLAKNLVLSGIVVSKSGAPDKAMASVVVKSTNRPGTVFTFTRVVEEDGRYSYSGRLLNRNAGDALEITREGGSYLLRKKGYYDVISE